jgi:hypothetical protein
VWHCEVHVKLNQSFRSLATQAPNNVSIPEDEMPIVTDEDMIALFTLEEEFDVNYGILEPQQTILVRTYSDDADDSMLMEIRPRFIIMFDPNLEFIRRVEVGDFHAPYALELIVSRSIAVPVQVCQSGCTF